MISYQQFNLETRAYWDGLPKDLGIDFDLLRDMNVTHIITTERHPQLDAIAKTVIGDDYPIYEKKAPFKLTSITALINRIKYKIDRFPRYQHLEIYELDNVKDRVFFNEKLTAFEWIDEKLAKIKISKLSPSWSKVLVRNDGYTHALLQGHWAELFFNALKYANHEKDEFLTLKFKELEGETFALEESGDHFLELKKEVHSWLQLSWDNPSNKKEDGQSGEGLEGIEEDLSQLNEGGRHYTLKIENKKNRFKVTLNYRSDLLIRGKFDPESVENYFS